MIVWVCITDEIRNYSETFCCHFLPIVVFVILHTLPVLHILHLPKWHNFRHGMRFIWMHNPKFLSVLLIDFHLDWNYSSSCSEACDQCVSRLYTECILYLFASMKNIKAPSHEPEIPETLGFLVMAPRKVNQRPPS